MSTPKGLLEKLLNEEEYKRAREFIVRYLAAYKVVEQNLSLFDKLARCRDVGEFIAALYEGMRVKDRVLDRLVDEVTAGNIGVVFEYKDPSELKRVFNVGHDQIERIVELAKDDPKLVGSLLSALALAYGGLYMKR
jgi:hypothetical protein